MRGLKEKGVAVGDECIHGFEAGLCDSCFPKPAPLVTTPTPRVARIAPAQLRTVVPTKLPATTSTRTSTRTPSPRRTAAAVAPVTVVGVGEQRLYHITHLSNLAAIIGTGSLLADSSSAWDRRPTVELTSPESREVRRDAVISDNISATVASYVPFFLSPDSEMWCNFRNQDPDVRIAPAVAGSPASGFIMLVSSVSKAIEGGNAAVVTDGDPAEAATRFATTPDANERMLRNLRAHEDSPALLSAEYLVADFFDFSLITLIAVGNDRARDDVKAQLKAAGRPTKVSVYPPWFQKPEKVELLPA